MFAWIEGWLPEAFRGRLLLAAALAFALGLVSAWALAWPLPRAALLCVILLLLAFVCALCFPTPRTGLLLAAVALGFFLCSGQAARLDAWPAVNGDQVTVSGRVLGAPQPEAEGEGWRLTLQPRTLDGQDISCAPLWVYGAGQPPRAGSHIIISGQVLSSGGYGNANAFDYDAYLRHQGIAANISVLYGGSLTVEEAGPPWLPANISAWLRQELDQAAQGLTQRQRALVYGVFLGDDSGLSPAMELKLGFSGMLHAFAVSGLHVGYVALLLSWLLGRDYGQRRLAAGVTLGLLLLYIGLTGASASVLRASLLTIFLLAARALDELNDPPTALAAAGLICLVWKPLWLLDAGFQLSFGAIIGLLIYYRPLGRLLGSLPPWLRDSLAAALGASLFTTPLIAYYFNYVSVVGWLLSPLVIAAVGAGVMLCFLALPLAIFLPPAAGLLLQGAGYILEALYGLAERAAGLPGAAAFIGSLSPWYTATVCGLLLALPLLKKWLKPARLAGAALAVTALCCLLPGLWLARPPESSVVTFIDVGQGDATLIRTREGQVILIDGGGAAYGDFDVGYQVLLPYLRSQGVSRIDLAVSSHPDADHCQGLIAVAEQLPVGALLYARAAESNALQEAMLAAALAQDTRLLPASAGDSLTLSPSAAMEILSPGPYPGGDGNDDSLLLRLSLDGVDILFTGDVGAEALTALAGKEDLSADIVKLPHHGSGGSYSEEFYLDTGAGTAVISVGEDNNYGHPAAEVVQYWQRQGELYRTDIQGAVTVTISQGGYSVSSQWEGEP